MGNLITVRNADFSANNINGDGPLFDRFSDNIVSSDFEVETGDLTLVAGASSTFDFAFTVDLAKVSVKAVAPNPLGVNPIGIGLTIAGHAITIYLDGSGEVKKAVKTSGLSLLTTLSGSKPNVAIGSYVTVEHFSTFVRISYPSYTRDINYADIPEFFIPAVGNLCFTSTPLVYNYKDIILC